MNDSRLDSRKLICLAVLSAAMAVGLTVGTTAFAQNAAVVNGKPIAKARVDEFLAALAAQGRATTPELREMVREELISRQLFMQEAERKALSKNKDVQKQLDEAVKRRGNDANGGAGVPGGSGGGAGNNGGSASGAAGTSGQGFAGGNNVGASPYPSGGGGGSSAVGANGAGSASGAGGAGTASSITGSSVTYAGGGGGASTTQGASSGAGGSGGGGAGGVGGNGTAGTANLGGGGGGASNGSTYNGGAGGSGVVILSVPTANYTGVTTGSPTVTTSGTSTIIKFTASGSYTA